MDEGEETLKAGDVCLDCQQLGIEKYLRYFKINLNGDTLLKCESDVCMYPYEVSSTDDEDDYNNDETKSISETNSIQVIDDLLQQIKNEAAAEQNYTCSEPTNNIKENVSSTEYFNTNNREMQTYEISFLDTFDEFFKENIAESKAIENIDNKTNFDLTEHEQVIQPTIDELAVEPLVIQPTTIGTSVNNNNQSLCLSSLCSIEPQQLEKPKINIQSVETINLNLFSGSLPTTSEMFNVSADIELKTDALTDSSLTKTERVVYAENDSTPTTFKDSSKKNSNLKNVTSKTEAVADIPKASLAGGSDLFKRLAIIEEKTPKHNTKYKAARRKPRAKKTDVEESKANIKPLDNTKVKEEKTFSLEAVSKLLNAKRI